MLSVLQIRPDELNHWCQSLLEMASIVRSQWSSVTMEFGRFPTFRQIKKWWCILISWLTLYCSFLISILACLCILYTIFLVIWLWLQNMKKKKKYHPGCTIYFFRLFESKLQPRSPLTHWATILQTIYKFISCMTILIFWLKFYRSLFQLAINQQWAM